MLSICLGVIAIGVVWVLWARKASVSTTNFMETALVNSQNRLREFSERVGGRFIGGQTRWSLYAVMGENSWDDPDVRGAGARVYFSYRGLDAELTSCAVADRSWNRLLVPRLIVKLPNGRRFDRLPVPSGVSAPSLLWARSLSRSPDVAYDANASEREQFEALAARASAIQSLSPQVLEVWGTTEGGLTEVAAKAGRSEFQLETLTQLVERTAAFVDAASAPR
jgi:hypothetical protein